MHGFDGRSKMIGIIGSLDEELIHIRKILGPLKVFFHGNRKFWRGKCKQNKLDVVLTRCSRGKVNAAIAAQQLIDVFRVQHIFNMGSAGGLDPSLSVGDIVVAQDLVQHDIDLSGCGLKRGELMMFKAQEGAHDDPDSFDRVESYPADQMLSSIALKAAKECEFQGFGAQKTKPKIYYGRVLTGDQFIHDPCVSSDLLITFKGLCVEMEGAAIAHTCAVNNVSFLCVRAISDKADNSAFLSYSEFLISATANYATIFAKIFQILASQNI